MCLKNIASPLFGSITLEPSRPPSQAVDKLCLLLGQEDHLESGVMLSCMFHVSEKANWGSWTSHASGSILPAPVLHPA